MLSRNQVRWREKRIASRYKLAKVFPEEPILCLGILNLFPEEQILCLGAQVVPRGTDSVPRASKSVPRGTKVAHVGFSRNPVSHVCVKGQHVLT